MRRLGCHEAAEKPNPKMIGILFDLPHAIDGGRRHLESAGVAARCEVIAGDFFSAVPGGADAYLLKSVIHDWNDEDARRMGPARA